MKKLVVSSVVVGSIVIILSGIGMAETKEATGIASIETSTSTDEPWYKGLIDNATHEAKTPTFLLNNDTAYMNPRPFLSYITDMENKGYNDFAYGVGGNAAITLIPIFSFNGDTELSYKLKWRAIHEAKSFPAMAFVVFGGSYRDTKYGYDIFDDDTYVRGYIDASEVNYRLVFSKNIGDVDHVHIGYDIFNGSLIDEDDNKNGWDSNAVFVGYDKIYGRFRSIIDAWYDTSQEYSKSSIGFRGPIDWWFQFQLGYLFLNDYEKGWSDQAVVFGVFLP